MSDGNSRQRRNLAWACCAVTAPWFLGGCASANGPLSVREALRGHGGQPAHRSPRTDSPSEDTDLPVLVGFGVSKREHVQEIARFANGVVFASAMLDAIDRAPRDQAVETARLFVRSLQVPME